MIGQSATGQAHGDKTGQGRGLKEPAIARLNLLEDLQRFFAGGIPEHAGEGIPRRPMLMPALADGNECGERVAHHWQA